MSPQLSKIVVYELLAGEYEKHPRIGETRRGCWVSCILTIVPVKPTDTYLVKLRAETDPELLRFYPDPILKAHWNNLTLHYYSCTPDMCKALEHE